MAVFAEYERYDGLALGELVRAGEVTPAELCEAAIERIEARNPELNAIITPLYDRARETARQAPPDGSFAGVPFLLKDILHALAGAPLGHGSAALRDHVPDRDSEAVRRWQRAGLNPLGKTNTPEFALMGVTEPRAFGASRNPWHLARTPGGSSGGSAAAVAAGIAPLASGSDGGGSIRIPAACCGLFGLRPSRGRVPVGPHQAEVWDGASSDHVLTRSVRDSAAALDVASGSGPGTPYQAAPPDGSFLDAAHRQPPRLRIAFNTASPLGTPVHPDCDRAVRDAADKLEALGHEVVETAPALDGRAVARAFLDMYFGQVAADLGELRARRGARAVRRGTEPTTRALGMLGRARSAGGYVSSRRRWNDFGQAMAAFHQHYDLYLTPTLAEPPVTIGALAPGRAEELAMHAADRLGLGRALLRSGIVDRLADRSLSKTPFTQLANLTGQPAMSVPLYWTPEGLPCGVQLIAPVARETLLFRLAGQLERAHPWFHRRPPLSDGR